MSKYKYECFENYADQRNALFRLRYDVYASEKKYIEDDSSFIYNNMIIDSLDDTAHVFSVNCDSILAATARYNCTISSRLEVLECFPEYGNDYLKELFKISGRNIVLIEISRIATSPIFRNSLAIPVLFFHIFEHALYKYKFDGMVFKLRKAETTVRNLYKNFNCTIIDQSEKNISLYGNKEVDLFVFGYMSLVDFQICIAEQRVCKVLRSLDIDYYEERINKILNTIKQYQIDNNQHYVSSNN